MKLGFDFLPAFMFIVVPITLLVIIAMDKKMLGKKPNYLVVAGALYFLMNGTLLLFIDENIKMEWFTISLFLFIPYMAGVYWLRSTILAQIKINEEHGTS